jgi:hypothetical protein
MLAHRFAVSRRITRCIKVLAANVKSKQVINARTMPSLPNCIPQTEQAGLPLRRKSIFNAPHSFA